MRIISETLKATQIQRLPVLYHIASPSIRRISLTKNMYSNCNYFKNSLLYNTTTDDVPYRLISRKPIWKKLDEIKDFNVEIEWQVAWFNNIPLNGAFVINPNKEFIGMQYNRRNWATLNRFRTGKGRCNQCLLKWRIVPDGSCDCGAEEQSR